jgi:hypothetical protein
MLKYPPVKRNQWGKMEVCDARVTPITITVHKFPCILLCEVSNVFIWWYFYWCVSVFPLNCAKHVLSVSKF